MRAVSASVVLLPFAPLVLASACSLITSTDDLTGGVAEAGADRTSDAPADAFGDVADAVDAPEASIPFCASLSPMPALCEDFDGNNGFDTKFTQTAEATAGEIGADGAFFASPPKSFFSQFATGVAVRDTYAFMYKTYPSVTRVTFGFDIMLVSAVPGSYTVAAGVQVNNGIGNDHGLELVLSSVDGQIQESVPADGGTHYMSKILSPAPKLGKWARVRFTVSLAQKTYTVTVDGTTAFDSAALDPSWPNSGTVQLNLGMTYAADTSGPWVVRYDNVIADPK